MLALIIDSSPVARQFLRESLRLFSIDSVDADDFAMADAIVQSGQRPDVVVCGEVSDTPPGAFHSRLQDLTAAHAAPVVRLIPVSTDNPTAAAEPDTVTLVTPFRLDSLAIALKTVGLPVSQLVEATSAGTDVPSLVVERVSTSDSGAEDSPGIRVLVVDASSLIRRLLGKVIRDSSGFSLAATAQNGEAALEKIERLNPDVVTLDLEMPVLDGFETLKSIRAGWPELPVVVFSAFAQHEEEVTNRCRVLGASDYVAKPDTMPDVATAECWVQENLLTRIGQFFPQYSASSSEIALDGAAGVEHSADTVKFVSDPSDTRIVNPKKRRRKRSSDDK